MRRAAQAVAEVEAEAEVGGGGGGPVETANEPRMNSLCGSHWNVYVPGASVTAHETAPLHETSVERSTPGPLRWKLCDAVSSVTWIV